MKSICTGLFLLITNILFSQSFNEKADQFFRKYVSNGRVAYTSIQKNKTDIEELYKKIGEQDLTKLDAPSKEAFYINSYNLLVIYWVAKNYPLKVTVEKSGLFDHIKFKVAGEEMTLNGLEIKKILMVYKDGRIHFALACAAKSCPSIASFAFMPATLDKQLTDRAALALNNPDWLKVNYAQKKIELSKIFEWYKKDFAVNGKSEIEWINQYRKEKIPANFSIGYYEYNWALNEI